MLKELIRAIYEIANAIKGDNGNGGGENSNDNGLYGADGILVIGGDLVDSKVFLSQKELFDDFKENVDKYVDGYGVTIIYLYTENNIDKLLKPTQGRIGKVNGDSYNFQFSTNFLNEDGLSTYQFVSIQDVEYIQEFNVQKIVERLGNNVYVLDPSGSN